MSLTHGTLLGGRIRYTQPAHGYRTGIEPVLLAASIPARPGQRVLEAGTGAGAGLLCLAARVSGVIGTGLERDPDQATLAATNFVANGFDGLTALHADLLTWAAAEAFDHSFANPPLVLARGKHLPHSRPRRRQNVRAGRVDTLDPGFGRADQASRYAQPDPPGPEPGPGYLCPDGRGMRGNPADAVLAAPRSPRQNNHPAGDQGRQRALHRKPRALCCTRTMVPTLHRLTLCCGRRRWRFKSRKRQVVLF